MDGFTSYKIWCECQEEAEYAADTVDARMTEHGSGRNAVTYQIIGETNALPYDTGYVTDEVLKELEQGFIILSA